MPLRTLLPAFVLSLAACTGSGQGLIVTQEQGSLSMCWPEAERLAAGPRAAGIAEFRNRGRGTMTVEFHLGEFLELGLPSLAIPEGEVRSVAVAARKYFAPGAGLDYVVKDPDGVGIETGTVFVHNTCPPGPPPPPPPAVETYSCGIGPDLVSVAEGGFGPYAGSVALVGTSQGACLLDLGTGASDAMNAFLGRTYGLTAWSPAGKDVLLAHGPFGWWSRIWDDGTGAWGSTTLSGGGEPNVTAIVPKGGDRFADTAYYVGFGNNWIGKFEIVGGFVQATGSVVRSDVLPGETFIHAYSDDGQTFLVLTVEDGTGTNRLRIAEAGSSDPAVSVGTLGTGASQLAVVNEVWAVRTDTLLVTGTWDGANAVVGASVDLGTGGIGVALHSLPGGDTLIGVPLETSFYVARYSAPAAGTVYDLDPAFTGPTGAAWWAQGPDFLTTCKSSNNLGSLSYDW